jgi:flagellin-like hook-associated protein FlgL
LIFPDETKSGNADGETVIATITEINTVYTFKCVTAQSVHTWLLEGTCLYSAIADHASEIGAIKNRLDAIESAISDMVGEVE